MAASGRERTAYFLYLVGFLDLFGVSMTVPIIGRHARDLGASPAVVGILGSTYGLLQLISSPLVGYWSDRAGRRHVLICSLLLSALGYFLLASSSSLLLLFLSRIPTGLFKHSQQMSQNYLATSVPPDHRARALGRFNAFSHVGFIVGPVLAGHLSDHSGGFQSVAMATTAIFLTNLVLVWFLLPSDASEAKPEKPSPKSSSSFDVFKNLSQIDWAQHWDLFLVRFFLGFAVIVYRSNFSVTLDMKFQTTGKQVGYIISFGSIIGTLSGFVVGRASSWYNNDQKLLLHVSILELLSIASVTFAPSLTVLVISLAPLSLATSIARVCSTNLTLGRIKGDEAGAVLGCGASVLSTARMVSPMVGGLAQEYSETGPGVVAMVSAAVGAGVLMLKTRNAKVKSQ